MKELIKINNVVIGDAEVNAVSARELHAYLGVDTPYTMWISRQIEVSGIVEGEDFIINYHKNVIIKSGPKQTDCFLKLDAAKHIAMMSRSEKGKEIRQYFIDFEKEHNKPMSQLEFAKMSIEYHIRQEKINAEIKQRLQEIEAKQAVFEQHTRDFTVMAYANLLNIRITLNDANRMGRKCAALSRERDMPIGKVHDQRFGHVNSYMEEILMEVFQGEADNA